MRKRIVLLAVLGLAGCEAGETGGSGACAAALVRDGEALYIGTGIDAGDGVRSAQLIEEGFAIPGCNDGGGPEPDHPTSVFAVRGVSPELAVIDDGSLYVNVGYVTEVRDHPLHEVLHGDERRRRTRGSPCTVDGTVIDRVFATWAQTDRGRISVGIDARTRIIGFDRGGLPYVDHGDPIRIHGRCRDDHVRARRIERPA
jgi:hypothetical protein